MLLKNMLRDLFGDLFLTAEMTFLWSQINNQTGNPMNVSVQMWMVTNLTVTKYPIEMDGWIEEKHGS